VNSRLFTVNALRSHLMTYRQTERQTNKQTDGLTDTHRGNREQNMYTATESPGNNPQICPPRSPRSCSAFALIQTCQQPTSENQKEESLTREARRADNRGPKGRKIEIQLGGVGEHCKLPHWGLGRRPSRFLLWCSFSFTDGLW